MRWTDPPTRRELSLVFFSLVAFFISYALVTHPDPDTSSTYPLSLLTSLSFSYGKTSIELDGRRPAARRDVLEGEIFGPWAWDKGHVAGDENSEAGAREAGRHGAMWRGRDSGGGMREDVREEVFMDATKNMNGMTANDGFVRWGQDIPVSKVVQHVPGYTILDNVIMWKGKVYIVTDDVESFPPIPSIVVAWGPGMNTWEFISVEGAKAELGEYGGILRGVTWMSADTTPHNSTIISLWRTYASLDPSIDSSGQTTLPPPRRLIFPQLRAFSDPSPLPHFHTIRRRRVDTGFHPFFTKAAFPQLTIMYLEDWEDFHQIPAPFVIERIVVADREAAEADGSPGLPAFSRPFVGLVPASENWWTPVWRNLLSYFDEGGDSNNSKKNRKVVTYVHRQNTETGWKLHDSDHQALVQRLKRLEREHGYEVHAVSSSNQPDGETGWTERMGAIVKSSVVLGVCSNDLLDAIFMKLSPHATLMEFFPTEKFIRDEEVVMSSRGAQYIGWWYDRKFTSNDLPPVTELSGETEEIRIDVDAVVKAVQESFSL